MAKITWTAPPGRVIWNRPKSLRKDRSLTQLQVSAGADISLATLYRIEQGHAENIHGDIRRKLAAFFCCDVDDLWPTQFFGSQPLAEFLSKQAKAGKPASLFGKPGKVAA